MTETDSCSGYLRMSGAETGFGHFDFSASILPFGTAQGGEPAEPFRVSNFVLRIYRAKVERFQHPYGVLPQSRVLWARILYLRIAVLKV